MRTSTKVALLLVALVALGATTLVAQQSPVMPGDLLAQQELRASRYVYAAYLIAIVMVTVWAGSIAKRLSDLEHRLGE